MNQASFRLGYGRRGPSILPVPSPRPAPGRPPIVRRPVVVVRPPVRVGPTVSGQWLRVADPSVARLFTPQTPSFPAPGQFRNLGRWQVAFYRTRWYAKLTPFGAPISPGGTAPPPVYFVWVPGQVTLGPRGRFAGLGAGGPYDFPVSDGQTYNTGAIAAQSLLQVWVHPDAGDQYPPVVTFSGPNGQGAPTGVSQFGNQATSPFQFLVTGQPGVLTVDWVTNAGSGVHRHAVINVQAAQNAPPPPTPIPFPFPHPLPFPLPVHLPHPQSPAPAPPTGVPAPPKTGAPAPATSSSSTTTYVLVGAGILAAAGLAYWAYSRSRAPAAAPARSRAREAGEAPAAGIDRAKFERCVQDVKARGTAYNPWAVCNASLGRAARRR